MRESRANLLTVRNAAESVSTQMCIASSHPKTFVVTNDRNSGVGNVFGDFNFSLRVVMCVAALLSGMNLYAEMVVPREAAVCGPNAVAILLSIHGIRKCNAFFDEIDCNPNGATMLALRNAAISAGVAAEVRKVEVSELTFPAIVQTRGSGNGRDHYMVAYGRWLGRTLVIDATTGQKIEVSDERFLAYFSGYAIVSATSHFESCIKGLQLVLLAFIGYQGIRIIWSRCVSCKQKPQF